METASSLLGNQEIPTLIASLLKETQGSDVTNEVLYKTETVKILDARVRESFKAGVTTEKLEALGYLIWLDEASRYLSSSRWKNKSDSEPFNTDPTKAGRDFALDCVPTNNKMVEILKKELEYPENVALVSVERVNFVTPATDKFPSGDSQNVTYVAFEENGKTRHFVVDAAAYYFNAHWAKAFEGQTKIEVLQKERDYLQGDDETGKWNTNDLVNVPQ